MVQEEFNRLGIILKRHDVQSRSKFYISKFYDLFIYYLTPKPRMELDITTELLYNNDAKTGLTDYNFLVSVSMLSKSIPMI